MKKESTKKTTTKKKSVSKVSDDVYTAIGMALYEAFCASHDEESRVITFKRAHRSNSPWALKILTLRQLPRR
ncbi:hypothetical protein [Porphyromonas sp.]|uniref:hypothetical protein n=1 Tax=Porphyromonas sp. TaxID=1924944 RepID=UPI0026DCC503|nr:hypothetical protein [Porphyromonas sp.]MDO4771460.1 hypothetical protein [Porphyromonas sp.]